MTHSGSKFAGECERGGGATGGKMENKTPQCCLVSSNTHLFGPGQHLLSCLSPLAPVCHLAQLQAHLVNVVDRAGVQIIDDSPTTVYRALC